MQQQRGHAILELFDNLSSQNEKFRETVFAYLYEAQVESFKPRNNGRKSHDTLPLIKIALIIYI